MSNYAISCCSTCDLSAKHLKALGVPYGKYHYIIDGVDHSDDLFVSSSPEEFYGIINAGAMPTTSQVTPEELVEVIEPLLKQGLDVLHIEFSSGLSGGYQSALAAQETLKKKYPERKLLVVDSLAASSGYGLLVDKAAELKNSGMSIDDLYAWLEENKLRLRHWFFSDNLQHFKRGGRVSGASAAIGTLLGICPVMDVNSQGKLIVRKKVVGKKKAIRELFNLMCEQAEGKDGYTGKCYISHSLVEDEAKAVAKLIEEQFKSLNGKVEIDNIGTVIGSHTGPGCVALFFFSDTKRDI
jgi:DegV family protein with EDD domain